MLATRPTHILRQIYNDCMVFHALLVSVIYLNGIVCFYKICMIIVDNEGKAAAVFL